MGMNNHLLTAGFFLLCSACTKQLSNARSSDMQQVYSSNEKKHSISNGIWGTVVFQEGNCMPMPGSNSTCKTYPVKRTIRIYQYTLPSNSGAVPNHPGFFTSFSTPMVLEVKADKNGFFQAELPAGKYSVVVLEEGNLYSNITDGQGGINPVEINSGIQKMDLMINYKASF